MRLISLYSALYFYNFQLFFAGQTIAFKIACLKIKLKLIANNSPNVMQKLKPIAFLYLIINKESTNWPGG